MHEVYPVHGIKFNIGTEGRSSKATDMREILNMESFGLSLESSTQEWKPMDQGGWTRALVTGKKLAIDIKGKRTYGDAGNDYVASLAWKTGLDCNSVAEVEFPNGSKLKFDCVVEVTNVGTGETEDVGPLEFNLIADGKPEFIEAVA